MPPLSIAPPAITGDAAEPCRRAYCSLCRFTPSFFLVDADVICQTIRRACRCFYAPTPICAAPAIYFAVPFCYAASRYQYYFMPSRRHDNATLRCSPLLRAELSFFADCRFLSHDFRSFSPQRLRDAPPPRRHFSPLLLRCRFTLRDFACLPTFGVDVTPATPSISALLFQYFASAFIFADRLSAILPPDTRCFRRYFAADAHAAPLLSPAAR
jgi:hypothetical protein